jgi:hypothetical protein
MYTEIPFVKVGKINIHRTLKSNLDHLKTAVKNHWDGVILLDGIEGSGKTTLAAEICYYLGYNYKTGKSSFNIDNIVWTPTQFEKVVKTAKPHDAILFDEFVMAGLSNEAMVQMQNKIINYFTIMRKKQLYVILILPYIFMGKKYFTVARTRCLIHVTTPDGIRRGYFKFYNYMQKKKLVEKGSKFWDYPKEIPYSFNGFWRTKSVGDLGINEEEYNKRKDLALTEIFEEKKKINIYQDRYYKLVGMIKKDKDLKWKEMPDYLDIETTQFALEKGYERYRARVMIDQKKLL